jgi:hypothetical protein
MLALTGISSDHQERDLRVERQVICIQCIVDGMYPSYKYVPVYFSLALL